MKVKFTQKTKQYYSMFKIAIFRMKIRQENNRFCHIDHLFTAERNEHGNFWPKKTWRMGDDKTDVE